MALNQTKESIETAAQIKAKIQHLEDQQKLLEQYADDWVEAKRNHDKQFGITIACLEAGEEFVVEGETIKGKVAATIKDKARAIIAEEYTEPLDLAKKKFENLEKTIDIYKAQLNGWQSINKHLAIT